MAHSVEILLREGNRCDLSRRAGSSRAGSLPPLDPEAQEGALDCAREERADRLGYIALAPLVWQGDLPGLREDGTMFVRDLGPDANRRLMEALPNRRAFLFRADGPDRPPVLESYEEGEALLWGSTR